MSGDFFHAVPTGGDVYLLSGILHDWDDDHAETILRRCHEAMPAAGTLLDVDRVLPESGISPQSAFMDLNMLVTLTGVERTAAEFELLLRSAGFRLTRIIPLPQHAVLEAVRM